MRLKKQYSIISYSALDIEKKKRINEDNLLVHETEDERNKLTSIRDSTYNSGKNIPGKSKYITASVNIDYVGPLLILNSGGNLVYINTKRNIMDAD